MSRHDWMAGAVGGADEAEVEEAEPWAAGPSPAEMSRHGCRPRRCRRGSRTADLLHCKQR